MISVFGSLVGKSEVEKVTACLNSQWLGFGKVVEEFEHRYKEKFAIDNFIMVDSGSNALYMAVSLLDLPKNSEIILPSFTWVSCAQAIILAGHRPVFCDVDYETMNVRREDIEKVITKNTAAIMIVHYAGLPVDMDPIINLGYPVIEDAAHALDSTYKGKRCGCMGDVGIYSFDAVKNLTVGEGGGLATRKKDKIVRAKSLRYCGIGKSGFDAATTSAKNKERWWEYNISESFIKMLPNNISASIGLAQLEQFDTLQNRRKEIWNYYSAELQKISAVKIPVTAEKRDRHSYFTYCIRCEKRDELANFLLKNDIYTTLRYHPLHLNPIYNSINSVLPNTERLNLEALSIPLHPRLSDKEVKYVVDKIGAFYEG